MMMNLFSSFDPSNFIMKMGWMKFIIFMFVLNLFLSKFMNINLKMMNFLSKEFKILTESNMANLIIIPLFLSIIILNFTSLFPFSFCPTAQVSFVLPFAFSLWLSNVLYSFTKHENLLAHLVPNGSPLPLAPFLVLIELTSNLIRPITLSIRLVANIIAGHLLIHLLTDMMMKVNLTFLSFSFILALILSLMELGVAMIQGYIFSSLLSLYSNEIH